MTTGADLGIGTKLAYETVAGASPFAWTETPQVGDFPELGTTNEFVETTNQDSLNRTREYIAGLKDTEEVQLEANYLDVAEQNNLKTFHDANTKRIWRVRFSELSPEEVFYFEAFVAKHTVDGPLADVRKRRFTLRITGPIVADPADLL